jgi:polyhydroxybutyrate depolymerase
LGFSKKTIIDMILKNLIICRKTIVFTLFAVLMSCSKRRPLVVDAQTAEGQILLTMEKWGKALKSGDIDQTMQYYSENFSGTEAKDKKGMRALLNEAKSYGMLMFVDINLETADLMVAGDSAEIIIYNDDGELDMDFALAKEKDAWRIIGIPSEVCSYEDYAEPYGDDCLFVDDHYRCWDIQIPESLTGNVPLVIDLHGWTENASHQRSISGFEELANSEGFITVWPYGLCSSWNAGPQCCAPASDNEIDDMGFVRKMIGQLVNKHNIDENRIYVTGLSNGCAMTQRLANEASDLVAAVACMSLHLLTETDPKYSAVPVMTIMGTKDDLYLANDEMPGAAENFERWKTMNNCLGTYEVTWTSSKSTTWTYTDCEDETEVAMVTIEDGGHMLYEGEETEINTTRLAWDFMKKFKK